MLTQSQQGPAPRPRQTRSAPARSRPETCTMAQRLSALRLHTGAVHLCPRRAVKERACQGQLRSRGQHRPVKKLPDAPRGTPDAPDAPDEPSRVRLFGTDACQQQASAGAAGAWRSCAARARRRCWRAMRRPRRSWSCRRAARPAARPAPRACSSATSRSSRRAAPAWAPPRIREFDVVLWTGSLHGRSEQLH